ncbi:hypothetical protein ES705_48658 [subsurface metagenome]
MIVLIIFFADRYHLRHYSLLISADDYKGMKLGPVGSATKDILKEDDFFFSNVSEEDNQYYHKYLLAKGSFVKAKSTVNYNELSESEKEALNFSIKHFGKFNQFQLADITHDYPEWKKHKELFDTNIVKRVDMDEIDFLENPRLQESPYIQKYFNGIDPFEEDSDILESIKEDLLEQYSLSY